MSWIEMQPASIVALADAGTLFKSKAGVALYRGYLRLLAAAGGAIPAKNALDLSGFAGMLADAALCAVSEPDRCEYRITGERLKQRVGFNPTGTNYYDLVPAIRRPYAIRAMRMVVTVPSGFRALIEQTYSSGEVVTTEAVGFPLRSEEPGIDGFILFSDQALERRAGVPATPPRLLGANVVRRDLIDLGFGVDTGFRDLVHDTAG